MGESAMTVLAVVTRRISPTPPSLRMRRRRFRSRRTPVNPNSWMRGTSPTYPRGTGPTTTVRSVGE
ncbi:MAG: hypothetical protein NT049_06850 [Planctomycetota bacterium]|nr:hypothetical protein [Planctomycetota bacterium]